MFVLVEESPSDAKSKRATVSFLGWLPLYMPWQRKPRELGCVCVCVCEGMTIGDSVALVHTKISARLEPFFFPPPDS